MVQKKLTDSGSGKTKSAKKSDKSGSSGKGSSNSEKAQEMALKQREISVSEFFEKNRHLLGFDNRRKALMTTIKEAVDNSLDACEEAGILPELIVEIIDMGNNRFRVVVEDNGPGIVKAQIPKIFAKLLYGSKFHRLKMSRGQQGIGISASVMYAQLTTGRATKIMSKIGKNKPGHYMEIRLDTRHNKPEIQKYEEKAWKKDHGTRIELDLEGDYVGGSQSVDEYLKQTSITNPHATIIYTNPKAEQRIFARAVNKLPPEPKEIKPHPYGIELGRMMKKLRHTETRTLQSFLTTEFCRVGGGTAKEVCENAALLTNTKPKNISREMAEKLMDGIKKTRIINPPTDCVTPIGAPALEKGMRKEINAEFYTSVTRPPSVYRGNPFLIEAGLAYGGELDAEGTVKVMRYANRVPLLYQQGGCAVTRSAMHTMWRSYGLSQSKGQLPAGPVAVVVHIASVWVPFTSESKEAIAHYPEIMKDIRLALQEVGRKLGSYVKKKKRILAESHKRDYIETYIPHVAEALKQLLSLKVKDEEKIKRLLKTILEKHRGKLENIKFDPKANADYDGEVASSGKKKEKQKTLNEK